MTLKDAKAELKALGFSLRKRDDEYRVNRYGASEESAYYTTWLDDAVGTARVTAARA